MLLEAFEEELSDESEMIHMYMYRYRGWYMLILTSLCADPHPHVCYLLEKKTGFAACDLNTVCTGRLHIPRYSLVVVFDMVSCLINQPVMNWI